MEVKSEEHAKRSVKLMVPVKQIRNWHASKSLFLYAVHNSITVFNHHSLQIFQTGNLLFFINPVFIVSCHLVLFCPYCVKVISHNKSCLPVTLKESKWTIEQCTVVGSWLQTASAMGDLDLCPCPVPGQPLDRRWRSLTAAESRGRGIRVTLASEMQPWLKHLQGDFSKGESHFTGAERSVVSFLKNYFSAP